MSEYRQIWSLSSVPRLRQLTYVIDDVAKRQLVMDVIDAFESQVVPNVAQFSAGSRLNGDRPSGCTVVSGVVGVVVVVVGVCNRSQMRTSKCTC